MAEHRPLHEVIAAQLAHLCAVYEVGAEIVGSGAMSDNLLGLGAEIEALSAVLGSGVIPFEHLPGVASEIRDAHAQHLSSEATIGRPVATRIRTLLLNLGARGESVDGLRPLHEVLLRSLEHQMENFATAVVAHQDDKQFVVGAEIQACASTLMRGVVPASELAGAIEWLTRIESRMPVAESDPTVQAVVVALGAAHADLVSRHLSALSARAEE